MRLLAGLGRTGSRAAAFDSDRPPPGRSLRAARPPSTSSPWTGQDSGPKLGPHNVAEAKLEVVYGCLEGVGVPITQEGRGTTQLHTFGTG